jgi:hypothetical protein
MTYTEAKRAEYPKQDETALLIEFTAEMLARRKFQATGHASVSWIDWIGNHEEVRGINMAPYRAHAAALAELGMLSWPDSETPDAGWIVQAAGQYRGTIAAPQLDRIYTFGRDAVGAVNYFRALVLTGVPCRIEWSFALTTRKAGING